MFSRTFEDQISQVEHVLSPLKGTCVSLKYRKRLLFSYIVDYLGHNIHPGILTVAIKNTNLVRIRISKN